MAKDVKRMGTKALRLRGAAIATELRRRSRITRSLHGIDRQMAAKAAATTNGGTK